MKTPYEVDQALKAAKAAKVDHDVRLAEHVAKKRRNKEVIDALFAEHDGRFKAMLQRMKEVFRNPHSSEAECDAVRNAFIDYAEETGFSYIMRGEPSPGKAMIDQARECANTVEAIRNVRLGRAVRG